MRHAQAALAALTWIAFSMTPRPVGAELAPTADSLLSAVRPLLAQCDSSWTGATFVTTTHERKLDGKGNVEKETIYRSRVYSRENEEREVLLEMWEDGRPVETKKLRDEQEKREKERRKRAENLRKGKDDSKRRQSSRVFEPFLSEHAAHYRFPEIIADTMADQPAWRVTVDPLEESEDLVRGFAWLARDTYLPIAERYEPAKMPAKIHALNVEIDYTGINGCPMPGRFQITGHGKALIFIKFDFQAEIFFDSVSINPELPDSLFAIPGE